MARRRRSGRARAGAGPRARPPAVPGGWAPRRDRSLELHFRRGLGALLRLEVGLDVEAGAEEAGDQHRREALALGVEALRRLVVAHALDGDAVLGALELRLQVTEVLGGLEVRVLLDHHQQARQGVA